MELSTTTLVAERTEVLAPPVATNDGDHERMSHIVLEGFEQEDGTYVKAGPCVAEGFINRTAVKALCGKVWVPDRDPKKYPLCSTCKDIAAHFGWQTPA